MSEVREKKKGFTQDDFKKIGEFIVDEHRRRQKKRKDREKCWSEIERQCAQVPDVKYKRTSGGSKIPAKAWMPEIELPNQAQALELLLSDSMRLMLPDHGDFMRTRVAADDGYLRKFLNDSDLVLNSDIDPPSVITQGNVDDYIHGFMMHQFRQFDHRGAWKRIISESIKLGDGVGRIRLAKKPSFVNHIKGTSSSTKLVPIIAPVSIKDVFLDDMESAYMADGFVLGPAQIFHQFKKLEDVLLAAKNGSTDPDEENGGWMKEVLGGLDGDKNGNIEYLEYEGDLVVQQSEGKSIYIPGAIVTVVIGGVKNSDMRVVRFRFRKTPYSSYLHVPYQQTDTNDPYSSSPLVKGEPIQRAASESLNRFMQAAILNTEPVVRYSRDDQYFKAQGGPVIHPGAQWESEGDVDTIEIGNPQAILPGYLNLLSQHNDATGVNAPRLGAQTVSHTTAFAKDQEIQRGQVRTVEFTNSTIAGPMTRWVNAAYELGRAAAEEETVYMDKFGSFVNIVPELLPEKVFFEVYGASGPAQDAQEQQRKFQSILTGIQLAQLAAQSGEVVEIRYEGIIKDLLKQGGVTDVDEYVKGVPQGPALGPTVAGVQGSDGDVGAQALILQNLGRQ